MNDLISRQAAMEAIEIVDWYHQNSNKDMVHGANDNEHQAWYKADDVYKALEAVPSANRPKDGDLISRTETIEALGEEPLVWCDEEYEIAERNQWREDIEAIKSVPSAEAVPQSEQYKKGFEDAKRAFLVEYARESENMRKRIAQLEVMLNAQKAISADRPQGEWNDIGGVIRWGCSLCHYAYDQKFNFCPHCGAVMRGGDK